MQRSDACYRRIVDGERATFFVAVAGQHTSGAEAVGVALRSSERIGTVSVLGQRPFGSFGGRVCPVWLTRECNDIAAWAMDDHTSPSVCQSNCGPSIPAPARTKSSSRG